jgi:hypothetical protein
MCITQHDSTTGKTQTVSTEPHACTRCSITERELSLERGARQLAESQVNILRIDKKLLEARVTQLETQIAANFAAKGVR